MSKNFDAAYREGLKRREQAWRKRMASLEGKLYLAARKDHKRDPGPLIEYFLSGGTVSEKDGPLMAWFLARVLPQAPHRPRGAGQKPKNFAAELAGALVWMTKRAWCRRNHTKIATKKTPVEWMIQRGIELVEPHIAGAQGQIEVDKVREFQKLRPKSEMFEYIATELPETVFEQLSAEALQETRPRKVPPT
jgi:hypothetical protein